MVFKGTDTLDFSQSYLNTTTMTVSAFTIITSTNAVTSATPLYSPTSHTFSAGDVGPILCPSNTAKSNLYTLRSSVGYCNLPITSSAQRLTYSL